METPVVPARHTCELSGHREPHLDEDSLRLTLLLLFLDAQPALRTACRDTQEHPSLGDQPDASLLTSGPSSREQALCPSLSLLTCLRRPGSTACGPGSPSPWSTGAARG